MDALKTKRATLKSQFTRAETRLIEALDNSDGNITATTLQRRYHEFQTKWDSVSEAHDSLVAQFADEIATDTEEAWIQDLTRRFNALEIKTDQVIESIEKKIQRHIGLLTII